MSKVFRLYKNGPEGISGWQGSSQHIGPSLIETILDPAGDSADKQVTSVPSPFARMDLVSTAFRYVVSKGLVEGDTIHHRIVSEALDIAQIFFNSEALKAQDIIEIIPWNAGILSVSDTNILIDDNSDLGKLLASPNPKLKLYGETLKIFLQQDRGAYNFDKLKQLYLINYKRGKGPELNNIIGGTSPATLFFSSANNDIGKYINNIRFGDHKVFDKHYCPLIKRSHDFIRYIFAFKEHIPSFSTLFKDFDGYLNLTLRNEQFPQAIKEEIRDYGTNEYTDNYDDLTIGTNSGFVIEVAGYPLKGCRPGEIKSDFEIATTKYNGAKPMVLPNELFNEQLEYIGGVWKPDYYAPHYDARPINERTLPGYDHIVYPYLTVSDFLEPYIIRIPYPVNKEKYFNGNFNEGDYGYILPIKKELFKHFNISDIVGRTFDGKAFFELVKQGEDAVEAILRIPIRNNKYIKFSRVYSLGQPMDDGSKRNERENIGGIVQYNFGMTIYPFLKTGADINADYRVQLIDSDLTEPATNNKYEIHFYKQDAANGDTDKINEIEPRVRSNKHTGESATSMYYVLKKEFDIAEIRPNVAVKGLVLPLMPTVTRGTDSYSFAIDFGTTNTHIEYRKNGEDPQPFNITEADIQTGSLHYNNEATAELLKRARAIFGYSIELLTDLIPQEFLPEKIGDGHAFRFPIRTVIGEHSKLAKTGTTYTLADFNIPLVYEKYQMPLNSVFTTNLKWTGFNTIGSIEERRVNHFIEKLLIMVRNKVLLNHGNPDATSIVWFYPFSMATTRKDTLEATWKKYAEQYISKSCKPRKLSESLAPFYYLKNRGNILAHEPMASLDIGGGTTDVVIYEGNKPGNVTSFRFAVNAIFGDGYSGTISSNGFVRKFLPIIKDMLKNGDTDELGVMEQIESRKITTDLITYFFSLESNKLIRKGNVDLSFSKLLKTNEQSKILFLFFYAAIIYHLARLMKTLNINEPRFITLSGTGSKIVNVIDNNVDLKNLTGYTNVIFSDVYGKEISNIELVQSPEPKELTCKGGLFCDDFNDGVEKLKTVLVGDEVGSYLVDPEKTVKLFPYDKLMADTILLGSVKKEVETFIDKFFKWHETFNYNRQFGALPAHFDTIRGKMKEDIMNYLKAGLSEKLKEVQDDKGINIEEPLFFYPLVGIMNKMAQLVFSPSTDK